MNLIEKYNKNILPEVRKVIDFCSDAADKACIKIFIIGGVVRDLIIDKPYFDTDITVEGDAIEFVKLLESKDPSFCKIKSLHDDFKTAKAIFSVNEHQIEIDFASTRKEYYQTPAALPTVSEIGVPLEEDLKRRDFTINSMAMSLNKADFGQLTDLQCGFEDLQNRIVKILHKESFVDDPTRMIRGLKFRIRFAYNLDKETETLQNQCIEAGSFDKLCGERIKTEIKQTFNLNKPEGFDIFMRENLYRLITPNIIPTSLPNGSAISSIINEDSINNEMIWLIYLSILMSDLLKTDINKILTCLNLSGSETAVVLNYKDILQNQDNLEKATSRFEIYEFFEGYSNEAITAFKAYCKHFIKSDFYEKIDLYLNDLKHIKISTTGKNLIDFGLLPGPTFGDILKKLLKERINKVINTDEEEKNFLKKIIGSMNSN